MSLIKINIVDDHPLIGHALKSLLEKDEDFKITAMYEDGIDLKSKIDKNALPDIVLMDISMPKMDGIESTAYLSENFPTIKVIALTIEDGENQIIQMIRNGAKGYLLKDSHPDLLKKAIKIVVDGGNFYPEYVTNTLIKVEKEKDKKPKLKEKELEFIKLSCSEMTYKQIAEQMYLSVKTIDGYRESVFQKLNVKSRVGMVMYAIEHKLFKK